MPNLVNCLSAPAGDYIFAFAGLQVMIPIEGVGEVGASLTNLAYSKNGGLNPATVSNMVFGSNPTFWAPR